MHLSAYWWVASSILDIASCFYFLLYSPRYWHTLNIDGFYWHSKTAPGQSGRQGRIPTVFDGHVHVLQRNASIMVHGTRLARRCRCWFGRLWHLGWHFRLLGRSLSFWGFFSSSFFSFRFFSLVFFFLGCNSAHWTLSIAFACKHVFRHLQHHSYWIYGPPPSTHTRI